MHKLLYTLSLIILFSPVLQSQEAPSKENDVSACNEELINMREWVRSLPYWKMEYPDPDELWFEYYGMLGAYISREDIIKFKRYAGYFSSSFKGKEDNVYANLRKLDDPEVGFFQYCMKLRNEK